MNGRYCGPGCQCIGCTNVPTASTSTCSSRHEDNDLHEVVVEDLRRAGVDQQQQESEFKTESEDDEENNIIMNNDSKTEEIMARVFGDDSENESDA